MYIETELKPHASESESESAESVQVGHISLLAWFDPEYTYIYRLTGAIPNHIRPQKVCRCKTGIGVALGLGDTGSSYIPTAFDRLSGALSSMSFLSTPHPCIIDAEHAAIQGRLSDECF